MISEIYATFLLSLSLKYLKNQYRLNGVNKMLPVYIFILPHVVSFLTIGVITCPQNGQKFDTTGSSFPHVGHVFIW